MNRRQKKKKGLLLVDKRKEKKVVKEVKEKKVVEEVKVEEAPIEEVVEEVKEKKEEDKQYFLNEEIIMSDVSKEMISNYNTDQYHTHFLNPSPAPLSIPNNQLHQLTTIHSRFQ